MDKPPMVMVQWEDAHASDASPWVDNDDHAYKPKVFTSVGFLLYQGNDGITLTGAWHEDAVGARDMIPAGMVRSVTPLEPVKGKRGRK